MYNETDESLHTDVKPVDNTYRQCCCENKKPMADETPYCCSEEPLSIWEKLKKLFS